MSASPQIQVDSGSRTDVLQVCLVTRLPSPYQVEFVNEIESRESIRLRVIYLENSDRQHNWGSADIQHEHLFLDLKARAWPEAMRWVKDAHLTVFNCYTHLFPIVALRMRCLSGRPWCFWGERPGFLQLGRIGRWCRRLLLRPLSARHVPIWGVGDFALEGYRKDWGSDRPFLNLPYFSDLDRFFAIPIRTNSEEFVILYSGMLIVRKDVTGLADAFLALARRHPNLRLMVLGEGPKEQAMRAILQPVAHRIDWLGFRPWNELPGLYARADLLCLPSRYDGWAMVVPEALASGLPVVATICTGAALQFVQQRKNGWLIDAEKPDQLLAALHEAVTLPAAAYEEMRRAARQSIANHGLADGAALFESASRMALLQFNTHLATPKPSAPMATRPAEPALRHTPPQPRVVLAAIYEGDIIPSMERYTKLVQRALEQLGYPVTVRKPPEILGRWVKRIPWLCKLVGYLDKYLLFPLALRRSLTRCAAEGRVIVHVTDQGNGLYLPWIKDQCTIVTCHDLISVKVALGLVPEKRRPIHRSWLQRLILKSLKTAKLVICVSEKTRSECLDLIGGGVSKFPVIHNPLDPEFLDRLDPVKPATLPQRYLLHVGNSAWYKNRPAVLRIYRELLNRDTQCPDLVLIGEGLLPEEARLVDQLKLAPRLTTFARPDGSFVAAAYHHAEALVFPSLDEGFGWPVLEAMALGCPVFASNRSPLTEIGGAAVEYIDPSEPGLAAALIQDCLLRGPEWRKTKSAAGLARSGEFNFDRFTREIGQVYERACGMP